MPLRHTRSIAPFATPDMTGLTPLALHLPAYLERLLGLSPDQAHKAQMTHISFVSAWPVWLLLLILAISLLWFGLTYWRDGTRPSWWIKGPLVALRLTAVSVLLLMLAQPTLRRTQIDQVRPNVLLLVDTSESMDRPDPKLPAARAETEAKAAGVAAGDVPGMTRLARAGATLNHSHLLTELSKRFTVRLYSFAGAPRSLPLPSDAKKRAAYRFSFGPDKDTGDSTQIGAALRRALDDVSGQPISGALIVSDGGQNLGEDPLPVAESARQEHVPISSTGVGDPTRTKDVALISVLADDVVRANNTVSVYASLSHRGYAGRTIPITLLRNGQPIARESAHLGPDEQKQEVRFTYTPTKAGRYYYTVSAAVQAGEITAVNNKRSFVQTVISKKLKVLYVENEPRYEYRYLKNAILRDNSLDFAALLLSSDYANGEGNLAIREFPRDEKALFDFDLVILGDVPRAALRDSQVEALRRFVEDRGGSLLVIAGEQHMPHEYAGTPLEAVLPAVISPSPDPILTDEPFRWQLTAEGRRSPISMLEDDPNLNAQVWENLPGMYWAAGVVRAKPGATVLAVHPTRRNADGPRILVAAQPFGAGKCFLQLVDSTYLWRWRVGDRYFYRYWGQVLRTLTPKELPGNSRFVQLNADRNNYRLGEKVTLNARLLDAYYRPIKVNGASATVKDENGQTQEVALHPTPGAPGLFTAQFQPQRIGRFEVSMTSPINPAAKASAAFVVESLALESQKPELDETLLRKIASAGGGRYYSPDELNLWVNSLPNKPLNVQSEQEIELWNAPLLLILFLLPLCVEWLVRKRKGLL